MSHLKPVRENEIVGALGAETFFWFSQIVSFKTFYIVYGIRNCLWLYFLSHPQGFNREWDCWCLVNSIESFCLSQIVPFKVFVCLKLSHFRINFFFIIFLYGFGNCLWFYYWVFSRRNTIYKRIRLLLPCEFHRQLGHIIFYMVLGSSYYLFLNFSPLEIQFVYLFNFCKREWGCQRLLSSINNWLGSRRIDMLHMIWNWTWVERITFLLLTVLSFLDPFDYIYIYIYTHTPSYSIYHPI